ncbi:MAG: YihA family ribosome biogenesis GTP-binding protein [Cytophagales bacterium]|nr:YihA family ribosome biogenesis GTP-binding protein [Cytophagales bacterium]
MTELITTASFVISSPDVKSCPEPDLPEYSFIGRSNVGKSSLINMITNHSKLAKVSGRPGKTQLINHFLINKTWYLVDLPGYGWAQVSKTDKAKWKKMIEDYLSNRTNLINVFVLIDSRHEPQKIDMEFMHWLGESGIPFSMVFTKTDKLSKLKLESSIANYNKELRLTWEELPPQILTSATNKSGKNELINSIFDINSSLTN